MTNLVIVHFLLEVDSLVKKVLLDKADSMGHLPILIIQVTAERVRLLQVLILAIRLTFSNNSSEDRLLGVPAQNPVIV